MHSLSGATLEATRHAFGKAYNRQMYVAIGLAAAQVPLTAMMITKRTALPPKTANGKA